MKSCGRDFSKDSSEGSPPEAKKWVENCFTLITQIQANNSNKLPPSLRLLQQFLTMDSYQIEVRRASVAFRGYSVGLEVLRMSLTVPKLIGEKAPEPQRDKT